MTTTPLEVEIVVVPKITDPPESMLNSENLVLRQANAMVISSEEDYAEAGLFLNEVIVAGKREVHIFFDEDVSLAHKLHLSLTTKRNKHLEPWEEAERIVKSARVRYFQQEEARRESERRERERLARAVEEERRRQEAEAERQRAAEESARRIEESERRRIAAEAEAERLRNIAAEQASEAGRLAAERQAQIVEDVAKREAEVAEASAAAIAEAGEAAAQAIEQEPIHIELPSAPDAKLGGVVKAWGVNKEDWNAVAFAEWIAVDPKGRAKYIGEPAWSLLTAEAKQQKSLFSVGGITAGPKYAGRAGK